MAPPLMLDMKFEALLPALVVADLHLTMKKDDEYRWGIFDYLDGLSQDHSIPNFIILGDVTDAKDNHTAPLVNRVCQNIQFLAHGGRNVFILKGNHDYLPSWDWGFFSFLAQMDRTWFINQPMVDHAQGVLFLPHKYHPNEMIAEAYAVMPDPKVVFMHQTVNGAVSSTGFKLEGEVDHVDFKCPVYSGDIHVPQRVGGVEYIGSPYHVHYGDRFSPRVALFAGPWKDINGWDSSHIVNKHFETVEKFTLDIKSPKDLLALPCKPGDQVWVRVQLAPSEFSEWEAIKREVVSISRDRGLQLRGPELIPVGKRRVRLIEDVQTRARRSPQESLKRFADHEKLTGDIRTAGEELL